MGKGIILILDELNNELYQKLNNEYQTVLTDAESDFFRIIETNKEIDNYIINSNFINNDFISKLEGLINIDKSNVFESYNIELEIKLNDRLTDYLSLSDIDISFRRVMKYARLDSKIKKQRNKENDALSLVASVYHTTFSVNLNTKEPSIIKIVDKNLERDILNSKDITIWLDKYVKEGNIHSDDLMSFLNVFNPASLKAKFLAGKKHIEHKYRRKINGIFQWQMLEVVPSDSFSSNNPVIIFFERDYEGQEESSINSLEKKINTVNGILIVDSSYLNRNLLNNLLREYNVLQANDYNMSFSVLNKYNKRINLIILNVVNDYQKGLEYIKKLKEKFYGKIPVILLGNDTNPLTETDAISNGAFDYVPLPFNPFKFKSLVEKTIKMNENSYLVDHLKYDDNTNLYSQEYFFTLADDIIRNNPFTKFDMTLINIANYRQIVELYGPSHIGEIVKVISGTYNIIFKDSSMTLAGKLGQDSIAILSESKYKIYDLMKSCFNNDKLLDDITRKFNFTVFKSGTYQNIDTSLTVDEIIERCSLAIDTIKDKYNSDAALFDDTYVSQIMMRQKIVETMKHAISDDQFLIYYQPKHSLETDKIVGAEALIRWNHPEFGFIKPDVFIPIFESNGFIPELDRYAWEKVCMTLNRWKSLDMPLIPISVNISRMDFYKLDVASTIIDLANKYEVSPSLLHLEITESAHMDDNEVINEAVYKLKEKGFKIELDDFGVGYSNMTSFTDIPIDVMKLDMSFLAQNNPKKDAVLKGMIELGRHLGVTVLCEGVETNLQRKKLKDYGCHVAQGYFYSKPILLSDFEEYVLKNI